MKTFFGSAVLLVALSVAGQTPVRLSWQEFAKDPQRVQSFRNAVATMKSRNTADRSTALYRTSWEYWANMHGYFGTSAKSGTVAQWRAANNLTSPVWDPYFAGVQNTSPPDSIAGTVWDQCQHGTDYFMPWHRLFLFYFEKTLQEAARDPRLRLPYWDYTNPGQLNMPAEFRTPTYVNAQGQTIANPLYENRRLPGWETNSRTLRSADTNIDLALTDPNFLRTSSGDGYQRTIELSPHGYVHCAVMQCRATVMGAVPYSSNDPIFWVHHANIDRLWDCWMNISGHRNPSSIMGQQFSYVNEKGQLVQNRVADLFRPGFIDYAYQQPARCARTDTTPRLAAAAMSKRVKDARAALRNPVVIGDEEEDVMLSGQVTKKRVTLPATASLSHPRQFALKAQKELPVVTELILHNVHFASHPRTSIEVYLARKDRPDVRAFVGTLSFFSDEPEGMEGHTMEGGAQHAMMEHTRVFDATEALHALELEGTGTLELDVVFQAADEPIIEGPDFDPDVSKVVVDEIELRVKQKR